MITEAGTSSDDNLGFAAPKSNHSSTSHPQNQQLRKGCAISCYLFLYMHILEHKENICIISLLEA